MMTPEVDDRQPSPVPKIFSAVMLLLPMTVWLLAVTKAL